MPKIRSTPLAPVFPLCAAGCFLAFEAARMLRVHSWDSSSSGKFLFFFAVEMFCAFRVVLWHKNRSALIPGVAGCLLLTLHAGVLHNSLVWVTDALIAGGTAAFLIRSRQKNTFLPFAAAFSAGIAVSLAVPRLDFLFSSLAGILLSGILMFNAVRLRHLRWCGLLLIILQAGLFLFNFPSQKNVVRAVIRHRSLLASLPGALLCGSPPGKMDVLLISARKNADSEMLWKQFPFTGEIVTLNVNDDDPIELALREMTEKFDIISVEPGVLFPAVSLRKLLVLLLEKADPEHGILLLPRPMIKQLPPGTLYLPVPGSLSTRYAAGRLPAEGVDPEMMDRRLQRHLAVCDGESFMPSGVIQALFPERYKASVTAAVSAVRRSFSLWNWMGLALLWCILRLIFSRRGTGSSFFSSFDNAFSAGLLLQIFFYTICANRLTSHLHEIQILWCLVLLLPFAGKRGNAEKILLLGSIILPWILTEFNSGEGASVFALCCGCICALSAGVTSARLLLEPGAARNSITTAFFFGIAAAGVFFHLFFQVGNLIPVLGAAALTRIACLLRA